MKLYIDIETYSTHDLRKMTPYRYVEDPEWMILMAAYALDDEPVRLVTSFEDIYTIPGLFDPEVTKVAHNAQFERVNFSRLAYLAGDAAWPSFLDPGEYHDTMAVAAVRGLPQSLGALAKALGAAPKDEAGTSLINWFCKPNGRTGRRRLPEEYPEKWSDFESYCIQDVATLREVDRTLGDLPRRERRVYLADQKINDRGIPVDLPLAERAIATAEKNQLDQIEEVREISGVENPNSNPQMMKWLKSRIPDFPNLQAETIEKALRGDLPDDVRRVLELRQELALVAAKKFGAAIAGTSEDGRLRGQLRYFGAHTGRWTGRGLQVHNLPRAGFAEEVEAEAAILDLELGLGADALTLKKLVRSMFLGPMTVVDYAAIEARVIAWIAGEQWALDAFAAGRDIYVETAARMSTPTNQLDRSQGKVAVLALGYNGGVNSLRAMGAEGTDGELKTLVSQWRAANTAITQLWTDLDNAFYRGGTAGLLEVEKDERTRRIRLPSGRELVYHDVKFQFDSVGRRRATFQSPQGYRADTYGGRLSENATQAIARDVLADALVRLDRNGFEPLFHVHDEIIVAGSDLERVSSLMTKNPPWADGLPLDGAGFLCNRYRKD